MRTSTTSPRLWLLVMVAPMVAAVRTFGSYPPFGRLISACGGGRRKRCAEPTGGGSSRRPVSPVPVAGRRAPAHRGAWYPRAERRAVGHAARRGRFRNGGVGDVVEKKVAGDQQ